MCWGRAFWRGGILALNSLSVWLLPYNQDFAKSVADESFFEQ